MQLAFEDAVLCSHFIAAMTNDAFWESTVGVHLPFDPVTVRTVCLEPEKTHGYDDQSGGSDFP